MTTLTPTRDPADADPTGAPTPGPAPIPWWRIAGPGLAIGLVSAVWGLSRTGLWLDESYSLGATNQLATTLSETHGTMAAYYLALTGWLSISDSVWWMRALSVLFALGAVGVTATVARRLVGDAQATLVAIVTPLTSLWLVYAQEARSYALVLLLTAVAWLAVDHALADAPPAAARRWWAVHTAVVVVMPLAHGLALLQVVPAGLVLLAAGADRTTWLRYLRGVVLGLTITGLLVAVGAGEVGSWVAPLSVDLLVDSLGLVASPLAPLAVVVGAVILIGAAVQVGHIVAAPAGLARARAVVPIAWGLVPFVLLVAVSVLRPSLVPRYVLGSMPGLALLMAGAVRALAERRPALRLTAATGLIAILALGHIDAHDVPIDGWTTSTEVVAQEIRPDDVVLLVDDETRPPFEAAWRTAGATVPAILVDGDRPLGEVRRFEDDDRTHPARWRAAAAAPGRVWVVGDTDHDDVEAAVTALVDGPGSPRREVDRWIMPDSTVTVVLLDRGAA